MSGRYLTVVVDHSTGTHKLLNWPSAPMDKCIDLCQSLPASLKGTQRLILRAHDNDGEGPPPKPTRPSFRVVK